MVMPAQSLMRPAMGPAPAPAPAAPRAQINPQTVPQQPVRAQVNPQAVPQQPAPQAAMAQMPAQQLMAAPPPAPAPAPQPAPAPPPPAPAAPQPPPQSVEQQALAGGGASNKQQIANFMSALNGVGAGSNNGFMNAPSAPPPAPVGNLVQLPPSTGPIQGAVAPGTMSHIAGLNAPAPAPQQAAPAPAMSQTGAGLIPQQPTQPQHPQPMAPLPHPLQGSVAPNMIPQVHPMVPQYAMSDETMKQNVEPAARDLHAFMASIGAHNYVYKNPEVDGQGMFTSPMAQELERTDLGKQAVIDTPRGKMVDYARLGGVNLAGLSVVHREQERLKAEVAKLRAKVGRK